MGAAIETLAVIALAGLCAGWLAGIVTKGRGFGVPGNTLVALAGSVAGLYVGGWFGLGAAGSLLGKMVTSLIGAFALLYIVARFRR